MFMVELRKLFALMVGTRRKYLDPSRTVEIFKRQNFPDGNESQQDVSEFTHKLLEWLEQAFQKTPNEGISSSGIEQNPMEKLFYGEYKSEGCNEGNGKFLIAKSVLLCLGYSCIRKCSLCFRKEILKYDKDAADASKS